MARQAIRLPRRVLITGANRGIGLEITRQSAALGDEVIACCRSPVEASDLMRLARDTEKITVVGLDVRVERDIKPIAAGLVRSLDLLVCNAGVLNARGGVQDPEQNSCAIEDTLLTNVAGVFLTARHFLPHLLAGAEQRGNDPGRIAIISSKMGSSARAGSSAIMYRASKAAATNLARCLAVDLANQNIAVGAYHPGWVQTDMGGQEAAVTPSESAAGLLRRFAALTMSNSGVFEDYAGVAIPF